MKLLSVLGVTVIGALVVITGGVVIQQTQVGLSDLLTGIVIVAVAATIGNEADRRRMFRKIGSQYFHRY